LTAATWPVGIALTSWDYMWRSTPMHRREARVQGAVDLAGLLSLPPEVSRDELLHPDDGCGPLFHRRYSTRIRDCQLDARAVMEALKRDPNRAAPTTFARFQKLEGEADQMELGDEYVVRMPGPWDGPVRVVGLGESSFRLATLAGHLESGQIEFRALDRSGDELVFEIESYARSSSRLVDLLYHRLRMAKEVQAHMWISFLERVVDLAGGRMTGGIVMETERVEGPRRGS
jgi:hypothetical protein